MFDYGCACMCVHCVCIDPWWCWLRLLVARSWKVKLFETSAQQSIICRGGRGRRVVHFIEHKQRNKSTFWQNVCSLLLVQAVTQPFYLAAEIHGRGCREPCQRKKIHGKTEAIDFLAELLAWPARSNGPSIVNFQPELFFGLPTGCVSGGKVRVKV